MVAVMIELDAVIARCDSRKVLEITHAQDTLLQLDHNLVLQVAGLLVLFMNLFYAFLNLHHVLFSRIFLLLLVLLH